jgi:endonuclease YncB( thermonuclease family)
MPTIARALFLAYVLILPLPTHADFAGEVVGVSDGDTLTVLRDREQIKVRLVEIDAPEKAQAFGNRSKQSLSELCFGKTATLAEQGKDRYGRTLAQVACNGIDANTEQVWRGMAWVYRKYAVKDSPLYAVEGDARAVRRGLWADDEPMPPWEWRKQRR